MSDANAASSSRAAWLILVDEPERQVRFSIAIETGSGPAISIQGTSKNNVFSFGF